MIRAIHDTAQHLHEFARAADLPGYAEKMERAAIELEKLEAELIGRATHETFQLQIRTLPDFA